MRTRHPEDSHDCIADELLEGAAVFLDDLLRGREVAGQELTEVLRVELLADPCRADEIREEDGDDPALLRHHQMSVVRSGRVGAMDNVDMLPWSRHAQKRGK